MMLGWISPAFPLRIVQSDTTNANPPSVQDPVRIDRTVNDQFGNFYHAIVDEPTLEMKGLVNSAPSIRSGTAQLDDLILGGSLTFQGLPVSGQAIRFELIANGTGFLPSTLWDLTATRMIFNGVPEPFNMNVTLSAPEGTQFDFLNTARLVIDLPPGSSVMSAGGFFEEGPAAVPEPSSILLLGCAVAALMFFPSATVRRGFQDKIRNRIDDIHDRGGANPTNSGGTAMLVRTRSALLVLLLIAPMTAAANVITDWDEKAVSLVQTGTVRPPFTSHRTMAILHVAMFDAINSIEPRYKPSFIPGVTHRFTNLGAFTDEVANALIYAGFHYRFSTIAGWEMGEKIGAWTVKSIMQPIQAAAAR
jgi:hypothetical protein